ncbi:MAG: phage major capsid protein [Pseudomonadota bacterium]|nr:phage major capsid protein [Pseudomonadota bacterium]
MSVHLPSLLAKRTKIRDDMRAMQRRAEEADPENATMSPEAQSAFDALKVALADLESAISNRAAVDAFERSETGTSLGGGDRQLQTAKRAFRPEIAIAGLAGLRVDDGPEREISAEMARRSGRKLEGILLPWESFYRPIERRAETTTGAGAGLIGVYLDGSQYVDALRANLVCAKLGARYIAGLDQATDFPRLSATATAQWVLEGVALTTDTTQAWNKISLRPHTVGDVVEFTRNMLLTSTPAVQDAVRNDLVQVIARAIDLAVLAGSGSPDPFGILNTTGLTILSGGTNGGALTWPAVLALMESVQLANAPDQMLGWAGTPRVRAAAMGALRFAGVAAGTVMEDPDELAGYPFAATTQLPLNTKGTGSNLSTLIFGAWDEVIVGMFGEGIEVLANPYGTPQFNSGNIAVRCLASADVAIRHIASFAALTDLIAA